MAQPTPYAPPRDPAPGDASPPARWLAVLLSLVVVGLGHVYAGRLRRGLGVALGLPLVVVLLLAAIVRAHLGAGLVAVLLLAFAAWIAAADNAARTAKLPGARRAGTLLVVLVGVGLFVVQRGCALVLRRFVLEAFNVPSGSMMPTLLVGDHFFVDKSPWEARRGDVVVFPFPEHPEQDFVKRVVGLPGDRIEFVNGVPLVNGVTPPRCRVGEGTLASGDELTHGDLFVEVLDGHPYLAFYDAVAGKGADARQGPWTVAAGEVFVVGDNRFNAYDSRMWRGGLGAGVPIATVHGSAFWLWKSEEGRSLGDVDGLRLPASMAGLKPQLDACLTQLKVG